MVATGECHSVREFVELAFSQMGLDYRKYITIGPQLYRAAEVNLLKGDAGKARRVLGWEHQVGFRDLVYEIVEADCAALGIALRDAGAV